MSTIVIGCKLPNGILMSAVVNGKTMEQRINGWNQSQIIGGHGITHEVPEALWNAWLAKFKNTKLVKGGYIFAHKQEKSVKAEAKEKEKNKSKLEQMDQPKDDAKEGTIGKADK